MTLGSRLRYLIEVSGGDVRAFAKRCGISERAMHDYLAGKRSPQTKQISKMAQVGVDIEWLLLGEQRPNISFPIPSRVPDPAPVSGVVAATPMLRSIVQQRAYRLTDRLIKEKDNFFQEAGVVGVVIAIWNFYKMMSDIIETHKDTFMKTAKSGGDLTEMCDLLLSMIEDKLLDMAWEAELKRRQAPSA